MLFAVAFFLNSAANFALGVALSALLGPAEFGRYATVALAATTLAWALFEWLRQSSLRFSGAEQERIPIAASLDAGFLIVMMLLSLAVGAAALTGVTFGVTTGALALTPLLAVAQSRLEFAGAQFRAQDNALAFALLYGLRQLLSFTVVVATAYFTRDSAFTVAAFAASNLIPAIALGPRLRTPGARLSHASHKNLVEFVLYAKPMVASVVI